MATELNLKPTVIRRCTPLNKPHPDGLCGRNLDSVLSLFCVNGYNQSPSMFRKRRSIEDIRSVLLPRSDANSYLGMERRSGYYWQGIVCECCYHQCELSELNSYCNPGPVQDFAGLFK
ncbi:insulin-like [Mya arenaria]|uniref:insulin-like n=1 Tax=Mya arenaria TaxID=6604 RepID=UPI0022DF8084|nr:insulin-like [Mya arenaria]